LGQFANAAMRLLRSTLGGDRGYFYVVGEVDRREFTLFNMSEIAARASLLNVTRFRQLQPHAADVFPIPLSPDASCLSGNITMPARQRDEPQHTHGGIELVLRNEVGGLAGMAIFGSRAMPLDLNALHLARQLRPFIEFSYSLLRDHREVGDDYGVRFGLTRKEREVCELICIGKTNADVAAFLGISLSTVKCHILHIFNKVGVGNRASLIAIIGPKLRTTVTPLARLAQPNIFQFDGLPGNWDKSNRQQA